MTLNLFPTPKPNPRSTEMAVLKTVASATGDYIWIIGQIIKAYPKVYKFPDFVFV